jgi:hypothetical protein
MKALFRKILQVLLPGHYAKKDLIKYIRKRRRIIVSPIQGAPFKLAGRRMPEKTIDLTLDDSDFLRNVLDIISESNTSNILDDTEIIGALHGTDESSPTRNLLVLLHDYKNKLFKEKEYQDLKDKTIYNPPGQKWAAPTDQQEDTWLLRFHDRDCREAIFTGEDAEKQAWSAWNRYSPSFNINLFRLAQLPKPE